MSELYWYDNLKDAVQDTKLKGGGHLFTYDEVEAIWDCLEMWDERLDGWEKYRDSLISELARRDEIISRLKEDAEKMYNWALDHYAQNECENAKFDHEMGVDLNSHRALMKELEEK